MIFMHNASFLGRTTAFFSKFSVNLLITQYIACYSRNIDNTATYMALYIDKKAEVALECVVPIAETMTIK